MDYYPVFLDLKGRPVLLVGGGHVAAEKITKLIDAGALVTVVAPELTGPVQAAVRTGRAKWYRRSFQAGDTAGAAFVFVATDDGLVNATVAAEARTNGALVNAADDAANCDFILPAVAHRGRLTLAASTGGSSPAMARWLRERMAEWLSNEVVALADLAAEVRLEVRERESICAARCTAVGVPPPLCCAGCPNKPPALAWQSGMDSEALAFLQTGDTAAARARLRGALGLDRPLQPSPTWREIPK